VVTVGCGGGGVRECDDGSVAGERVTLGIGAWFWGGTSGASDAVILGGDGDDDVGGVLLGTGAFLRVGVSEVGDTVLIGGISISLVRALWGVSDDIEVLFNDNRESCMGCGVCVLKDVTQRMRLFVRVGFCCVPPSIGVSRRNTAFSRFLN
jgi:hypothetical protein